MNQALKTSIDTLRVAVVSETPALFWQEAMQHVSLLLKHIDRYGLSVGGMPTEINEQLLAWIADQVFDGVYDNAGDIRDIYRLIAADHAAFSETEYAQNAPASLQSVLAERIRQIQIHCFYPEQDEEFVDGDLAIAAACYATEAFVQATEAEGAMRIVPESWPWMAVTWRPKDQRRNLVKAGALILAEIDRLDRAAASAQQEERHV
ncbi:MULTISPECIES: hypothetical protein [Pseudomonas]|uniref:hypothetical protein n=1 Tax=Pseudomonas TaxID=286 RepID=UPI0005A90318|nr:MULTISPECIES: hypothetical protein [Pseudomonas]AZD92021.1 hypothetical protein C4K13_2604 [Pseudomonas chlororaphis subsp. aureofaciens]KAB0531357.1 hypothetical protein F7R16_16215 [Pseudomonas chlororaphis subsp. aureofaciens]TSD32319.1 hypothetical protein FCE86_023000 [Pseudomonas sp. ATCC 13985]WDG62893.1 hypothetical protein PUP52_13430 [Pseudomonas chlororaphis]WDG69160.1 hypothetical protein PUP59_13730 [Pseudomonas chlororaphis]